MKTLNFYLEPKLELLPAFTELSKSAKVGMILFPLPDFAVQETPLGIFTLIPIDLTPISKSTDLKGGILQEIYQTNFGQVHFKNLVPCFIQKSPKAGSIIEGGMIVGEVIKSVYPVQSMDGKLVPIHKSQAIVIADDLDNLFAMKLTADENRQELLDLMDEFSPKIDIMKSIFGSTATEAVKATNTKVQQTPPQGEQKSNPGNSDENTNSAGHSTPPAKSNAEGAERPGHKYLSRKRNPRYPSGSNSKYIYLYKLANGTAQWQDGSGQPVTESSTVPTEKTSVVQKIVDLFKQKSGKQEQKSPTQPPKEDSQPQPEKPVNPIGINSQFTVKGDKNRLYRAVTNISDKGYLVEDDRGELSIMSHEQVKQKAETHHNFQNGNTISINGKDHNIVKVVKNLILAKDPENGKLSFHGTFGTNPVSVDDEVKSKQIWEARNESIRQQKEQMAETERKWAQNKVEIAHVAEKHGFKSDPGMPIYKKSVQVFGSDADIQLYHDGKSVRSTINGSKVKWNIGGESLEVFDFNPDKMEITASHEDGTKTTHSFNEVKRFQPGYLHFGNDGGLSVSYTGEEGQQHDRINLEHLGQFSPIDLVNNQKAAYIIKSGVYAAVQSGDRIQFQKVGTLANGVVIAKGNHVAGVIDESTGRPALVNQSNIQNIVPHDENSTELQDVAKSFQENATGNMHGESVPRQEIITKYQATLEGHKQNVEQIKSDIAKTSDPFERDRLVTSLAHAELQFGQAKEAVLRAQTHIGSRIPKNIVGYHEAKRQKEDLQMIVDGHEKYIQAKRARLQVLSIAHQTALSDPSQHEQAGKMFKEMFDIHTDINRAQKEKTKVEKQLSVANDTMTKVSQSNGGFVPSSLHELSVPEGNRQDVFTKLSNPRNDLKGSDGSVLPQYTTTGKLADTIIHHLDAAGTAKPYEKPAIWNRINEFLSGARVITTPGVSHEIEGVNRPFTPEEIEQFPALEHLGQMEQDHDYGTELISAMARELHSHPDLAGQGHTEHDAIEGLYGIKLNKTTPEHHQFSGSVLPNEESKPVSVRQSPVPSAAKNQNEHTKVGTATHIDAIKEHLSQPENAEKLGDLDEFGALSHELGQKITDDQLKQNEISSHFQDDSGIGLPTHQTEGQDGNTLINSRQIIEDQAIATHEADRVKGDTNPVIATRIPEEGSEPSTMELLNHERKFGPEGLVNPFSLRVHKVFPQKLEKEIRENLHNMPAGTTVESVMSKLNFALHGDEFESYQGRDETDVNRAMNYALKWDSEIQEGDPVFYHSPTGSDFHAFSGNHRTLGAQLYGAIHGKIPSFYAKQFLGKREDAVQKGEDNNLQGETETPKEFAYKIKKWASEYGSDFPEKIRERLGKSKETVPLIKKLHRLSHLDRDGSFWQYMEDPAYKEMKIDRFADFSAGLRKTYPELTDRHEQEIFDHLFNNRDELMNLLSKQKIPGIGGEKVASHRAIMDKIDTAVQLKISDPSFKPDDRLNLNVLNSVKKQSSAPANWRNLDDQERDRYNELSPMFEGPKGKDQIELTIKNYIEARTKAYKDSGRQVTGSDNAKFLEEAKDHIQALREEHASLNEKLHFVDENQEDMFGGMFNSPATSTVQPVNQTKSITQPLKSKPTIQVEGKHYEIGDIHTPEVQAKVHEAIDQLSPEEHKLVEEHAAGQDKKQFLYAKLKDYVGGLNIPEKLHGVMNKIIKNTMKIAAVVSIGAILPFHTIQLNATSNSNQHEHLSDKKFATQHFQDVFHFEKGRNESFSVVDKQNAKMYLFDKDLNVIHEMPVVLGAEKGEAKNTADASNASSKGGTTPAGSYGLNWKQNDVNPHDMATYGGNIVSLKGSDGLAVHQTYPGEKEAREKAMDTETPDDNRMSFGCINISQDHFENGFKNVKPGMIHILPDDNGFNFTPGINKSTRFSTGFEFMFKSSWIQQLSDHYDWIEKSGNQIGMFDTQSELSFPEKPKALPGQTRTNQAGHQETLKAGRSGKNRWQTDEKQPIQKPVADLSALFFKTEPGDEKKRKETNPVIERMVRTTTHAGTIKVSSKRVNTPQDFVDILAPLANSGIEHTIVLGLDKTRFPVSMFAMSIGIVDQTLITPREILMYCERAPEIKGIILCHNHPSGRSKPSEADLSITKKIGEVFEEYNKGNENKVAFIDHIIIGRSTDGVNHYSMRAENPEIKFESPDSDRSKKKPKEINLNVKTIKTNIISGFDSDDINNNSLKNPEDAVEKVLKYIPSEAKNGSYLVSLTTSNNISAIHPMDIDNEISSGVYSVIAQVGSSGLVGITFGNPEDKNFIDKTIEKANRAMAGVTKNSSISVLDYFIIDPTTGKFYSHAQEGDEFEIGKSLISQISRIFGLTPILKSWYKIHQKTFAGLPISIENAKGTDREGTDKDGHHWKVKMYHDYGYIRRTEGTDGDQIDVYLGPDEDYDFAFIVHQNDPVTGKFDEDKVMLGFSSAEEARKAYQKQYDRPGFFGSMEMIERKRFEKMVRSKIYKGKPLTVLQETI